MKILLLGSEGTLGQYLKQEFKDYELLARTHNDIDITDLDDVERTIINISPSIIINATAFNDVEGAETKEGFEKANLINGISVGNLAEISAKTNSILVHFSSDYIFDGNKEDGYKEDDDTFPINNYGKSKLLGEQLVRKYTKRFYIIRMSRLFGKQGQSKNSKKNFVDSMISYSNVSQPLRLVDDEKSSPTYALDASKAVKEILLKQMPFGIYHVTNSGYCTWYKFATEIFSKCKKINSSFKVPQINSVSSTEFKQRAKRPKFSILLNTKLPALRSWEDALEDYLKTWFEQL